MDNKEEQKQIAVWKMERGFAEADDPNSMTRKEIMETFVEPQKEQLRDRLLKEYLETFGKNYEGDIIEDIVFDLESKTSVGKVSELIAD